MIPASLLPGDDWLHEPQAAPGWQENWLFVGLDAGSATGFYVHFGRLPDLGRYDVKVAVAVGGETVSAALSRPLADPVKDDLACPGLEVIALEPFRTWRVRYHGTGRAGLADGLLCTGGPDAGEGGAGGSGAGGSGRSGVPLRLDVTFEALAPPLDMAEGIARLADDGNDGGHYEQALRWRGTAQAGGMAVEVGGLGIRDHSWGVRRLAGITGVWWAPMVVEGAGPSAPPTQLAGLKFLAGGRAVRLGFRQDGGALAGGEPAGSPALHTFGHFDLDVADADHAVRWERTALHYGAAGEPGAVDVSAERILRLPVAYPEGWGTPFVSDETLCRLTLAGGRSGFGIVEWNGPWP